MMYAYLSNFSVQYYHSYISTRIGTIFKDFGLFLFITCNIRLLIKLIEMRK